MCYITADHILFDAASPHSAVCFFLQLFARCYGWCLLPDAVLKHLHLEHEWGGAEQPVHRVKFSIGTVFDVFVLSEGGGVRVKGGNRTLSLYLTDAIFGRVE